MSKYLQPKTETFYALVSGDTVRLIFFTEESAQDYLANHAYVYPNTHIQKVYSETRIVEVEDDDL